MSRTPVLVGHKFMTTTPNDPDLAAIVRSTEAEILMVETLDSTSTGFDALSTAELGYYEAELGSLHAAAAMLDEVEHPAG